MTHDTFKAKGEPNNESPEETYGEAQEAALCDLFTAWCESEGLKPESADEILHRDDINDYQREWLSAFVVLWDLTMCNADGSSRV